MSAVAAAAAGVVGFDLRVPKLIEDKERGKMPKAGLCIAAVGVDGCCDGVPAALLRLVDVVVGLYAFGGIAWVVWTVVFGVLGCWCC